MNRFAFTLTFLFLGITLFSQKPKLPDTLVIYTWQDEMTDEYYYSPTQKISVVNDEVTRGFVIEPVIEHKDGAGKKIWDEGGKEPYVGLTVNAFLDGKCYENCEMIFLFEDSTKFSIKQWGGKNCERLAYFDFNSDHLNILRKQKIKKIRLTNGIDSSSYTGEVLEKDKDYFIRLLRMLDKREFHK